MFRLPHSRREFLKRTALISFAPTVPAFLQPSAGAAEPETNGRMLVVIQLSGGNDGINTVVPYADEGYAKHRDQLRLATSDLYRIDDQVGLHPALRPAAELFEDGRLAIVQGVGYPNPNRSHEVSMAIWHTARFDPTEHTSFGWLGRAMDGGQLPKNGAPHLMLIGDESPPLALRGRRSTAVALAHLDDLRLAGSVADLTVRSGAALDETVAPAADLRAFARRSALDAYSTARLLEHLVIQSRRDSASYPTSQLAHRLRMIAQLIKANVGTPVFYAMQDGYDTHATQLQTHARLLGELAGAVKAFLDDLRAAGLEDRVVVLCFSEFGRRVEENASQGTDHGTAGPVFLAGSPIKAGLVGPAPPLTDLDDGDLQVSVDFRRVYATVLEQWLGAPSDAVLDGKFEALPLFPRV